MSIRLLHPRPHFFSHLFSLFVLIAAPQVWPSSCPTVFEAKLRQASAGLGHTDARNLAIQETLRRVLGPLLFAPYGQIPNPSMALQRAGMSPYRAKQIEEHLLINRRTFPSEQKAALQKTMQLEPDIAAALAFLNSIFASQTSTSSNLRQINLALLAQMRREFVRRYAEPVDWEDVPNTLLLVARETNNAKSLAARLYESTAARPMTKALINPKLAPFLGQLSRHLSVILGTTTHYSPNIWARFLATLEAGLDQLGQVPHAPVDRPKFYEFHQNLEYEFIEASLLSAASKAARNHHNGHFTSGATMKVQGLPLRAAIHMNTRISMGPNPGYTLEGMNLPVAEAQVSREEIWMRVRFELSRLLRSDLGISHYDTRLNRNEVAILTQEGYLTLADLNSKWGSKIHYPRYPQEGLEEFIVAFHQIFPDYFFNVTLPHSAYSHLERTIIISSNRPLHLIDAGVELGQIRQEFEQFLENLNISPSSTTKPEPIDLDLLSFYLLPPSANPITPLRSYDPELNRLPDFPSARPLESTEPKRVIFSDADLDFFTRPGGGAEELKRQSWFTALKSAEEMTQFLVDSFPPAAYRTLRRQFDKVELVDLDLLAYHLHKPSVKRLLAILTVVASEINAYAERENQPRFNIELSPNSFSHERGIKRLSSALGWMRKFSAEQSTKNSLTGSPESQLHGEIEGLKRDFPQNEMYEDVNREIRNLIRYRDPLRSFLKELAPPLLLARFRDPHQGGLRLLIESLRDQTGDLRYDHGLQNLLLDSVLESAPIPLDRKGKLKDLLMLLPWSATGGAVIYKQEPPARLVLVSLLLIASEINREALAQRPQAAEPLPLEELGTTRSVQTLLRLLR